jgi:uncharacterized membrane protein (UPF0182 family)
LKRRDAIIIGAGAAVLVAVAGGTRLLSGVLVDYWWYRALGQGPVYTRILLAKALLYAIGFAAGFLAVASGIVLAHRRLGPTPVVFYRVGQWTVRGPSVRRYVQLGLWGAAVLVGFGGGAVALSLWHQALLFVYRVPFGTADPVFGRDVGFYVFTYPLLVYVRQALQVLVWLSLGASLVLYASSGMFAERRRRWLGPRAVSHVNKLVGLVFVLMAAGYFLNRYGLLYSTRGLVYGAGYTDIHARRPALWIMAAVSLGIAAMFFAARSNIKPRALVTALAVWFGCAIVFQGAYPAFLQWSRVTPNQLAMESPYIANAIKGTLKAYGLDSVEQVPYDVREDLTYDELEADRQTMDNVRLWDWRPLLDVYRNKQVLTTYYDFSSVDVDRYDLERGLTETMLAVREMRSDQLHPTAQTWVNLRLKYTHGYGLCMSPVNEKTDEGGPVYIVKDVPPKTPPDLPLSQPRVYYGRLPAGYVFVGTKTDEFDRPVGEGDTIETNRYDGRGGVPVGSAFRKLLFYMNFHDVKILLSDDIGPDSRVLYYRAVADRVRRLAPYLMLDGDPYAVVSDGRIVWVQDCYTRTAFYPYSEPVPSLGLNYIRNSVKAVVDAYDGTVALYVSDAADPLIRAYQRMFPGLYRPMSEMPAALRRHVRYPEDMFNIQADKYRIFHMQDPQVFYNKEDAWDVPMEQYQGKEQLVRSYYIVMRLAGDKGAEFVLMLPFTPRGKRNMVAWLGARCDGDHYGELTLFEFPRGKTTDGPSLIEAQIDTDPTISERLTLWNQLGSEVIRGNLLVIPVSGGILYAEPLFIQAKGARVPQLQRVITACGGRVAMAPTLEESLKDLFGQREQMAAPLPAAPAQTAPALKPEASQLVERALDHYAAAQQALKSGDWAEYGRQMGQMEDALKRLRGELAPATGE